MTYIIVLKTHPECVLSQVFGSKLEALQLIMLHSMQSKYKVISTRDHNQRLNQLGVYQYD